MLNGSTVPLAKIELDVSKKTDDRSIDKPVSVLGGILDGDPGSTASARMEPAERRMS